MYGDPGSSGPGESEQGANAALTFIKCMGIHMSIMWQSLLQSQHMAMYGDPGSSGPGESEQGANAALTELEKGLRLNKLFTYW